LGHLYEILQIYLLNTKERRKGGKAI
jgi:hypothetical protein